MVNSSNINIRMMIHVAKCFGSLLDKMVFVGGCATGLFITDPAVPAVRATKDVDVIVEVVSRSEYHELENQLRLRGFANDMSDGAPVCRWIIDDIKVDVMPTQEDILGFANCWYLPAIKNAVPFEFKQEITIQLVTAPYFISTKIEAFKGRGKGDYIASHDIEDIITILDGRLEILSEIRNSPHDLKEYLANMFQKLLSCNAFVESLSGHLLPDEASQARLVRIKTLMKEIASIQKHFNNVIIKAEI